MMGRLENGLEVINEMLQPDEEVIATILASKCDPPNGKVGKYGGALAITRSRLLFSGRYLAAKSQSSHQLSQVSSLNLNKSALTAHIQIMLTGSFENYLVKFRDAEVFMATAQDVLANGHKHTSQHSPKDAASIADEILKLAELHKMGVLSDDEFAAAKATFLNS
jgi:hypothetical protein